LSRPRASCSISTHTSTCSSPTGASDPTAPYGRLPGSTPRHVERLFRADVLRRLLDKELITAAVVANFLSWRHSGPFPAEARWDVLEFLARVIDHIPEPSQQTVRYWGFYANAARGKRRKAAVAGVRSQTSRRPDDDEFTRSSRPKSPSPWLTRLPKRWSSRIGRINHVSAHSGKYVSPNTVERSTP